MVTDEEIQDGFMMLGLASEEERANLMKVVNLISKEPSTRVEYFTSGNSRVIAIQGDSVSARLESIE